LAVIAVATVLLVAIALPATATNADPEKELPFSAFISGTDVTFNPTIPAGRCDESPGAFSLTTFYGSGEATRLGSVNIVAQHCSQPGGFYSQGELSMTAANGDVLKATYTNGVSLTPPPEILFRDDFTFVPGGTGRFVQAGGGGVEVGVFQFFTDEFQVEMEGVISYNASSRRNT
jgi:hypothetical protein